MKISNHYKELLLPIIDKHLPSCKTYLFGSRARNTHQEGADIDIAVDAGKKIDFSTICRIMNDIEESLVSIMVDVDYHKLHATTDRKRRASYWKRYLL